MIIECWFEWVKTWNLKTWWSSHGGNTINFDVSHRTVVLSANHFFTVDDGSFWWNTFESMLRYWATRLLSANSPKDETQDAKNWYNGEGTQSKMQWRQSKKNRTMCQGFIVARWAVRSSIAPKGSVDAGVQFRTTLLAIPS